MTPHDLACNSNHREAAQELEDAGFTPSAPLAKGVTGLAGLSTRPVGYRPSGGVPAPTER
jgi:hypothetical protein